MNTTALRSAAATPTVAEPVKLLRRIGSTTYTVTIRFSDKQSETPENRILRMIEREVRTSA